MTTTIDFDKSAVPSNAIAIKLRHGTTNAKLSRTPYNIESAIEALFIEGLDLSGPDMAYNVFGTLARAFARDKEWEPTQHSATAAAVEALVNMVQKFGETVPETSEQIARDIVQELSDMELIENKND